jgi:hypothetical protein
MSAPASVRGQTSESRLLEVGGVQGMWFPMEKARQLLGDVAALPKIRTELELVSRRLELEKERTTLLDRNVDTTEQIAIHASALASLRAESTRLRATTAADLWRTELSGV